MLQIRQLESIVLHARLEKAAGIGFYGGACLRSQRQFQNPGHAPKLCGRIAASVVTIGGFAKRRTVTVEFEQDARSETFIAAKCPLQPVGIR